MNRLLKELERLAGQHKPDLIALNEVARMEHSETIPVLDYLKSLGYEHSHSANLGRFNDYCMSGAALCSRHPISQTKKIVISKHGFAARRGYSNLYKEAISARITLAEGLELKVIVAHPLATIDAFKDHFAATNKLDQLVRSGEYSHNSILVGDMNEWRLIPGSFRRKVADVMHSRTGSVLRPTWRYNAHRFAPLRLNLDYVYWSKQSDFSIENFKVLSSNVSDHQPLLVSFTQ
jgi:endonuclease/exonuclease/phosphatase family metal-dependent hydrolase